MCEKRYECQVAKKLFSVCYLLQQKCLSLVEKPNPLVWTGARLVVKAVDVQVCGDLWLIDLFQICTVDSSLKPGSFEVA